MRTATITLLLALTAGTVQLMAANPEPSEAYPNAAIADATTAPAEASAATQTPCVPASNENTRDRKKDTSDVQVQPDAPQNHIEYGAGG